MNGSRVCCFFGYVVPPYLMALRTLETRLAWRVALDVPLVALW